MGTCLARSARYAFARVCRGAWGFLRRTGFRLRDAREVFGRLSRLPTAQTGQSAGKGNARSSSPRSTRPRIRRLTKDSSIFFEASSMPSSRVGQGRLEQFTNRSVQSAIGHLARAKGPRRGWGIIDGGSGGNGRADAAGNSLHCIVNPSRSVLLHRKHHQSPENNTV